VRALELAEVVAGPHGGKLPADLGAEVVNRAAGRGAHCRSPALGGGRGDRARERAPLTIGFGG
jgi:crotonobetainyl-CoA:carnitine CoA-transferase CaiB-like acyl-CoA transferase